MTILDRHDVTSLLTSRDGRRVTGTTLRSLDDAGSGQQRLDADLVVDASGRGSRAPAWLSEGGYAAPTKTHVDPNVAHASRTYRIPDGFSADWQLVMLTSQPPSMPRAGYLYPIEDGQWMVSLMWAAGQHPPTDEAGLAAFARSLRHPVIADALDAAEPVTPIRGHPPADGPSVHVVTRPDPASAAFPLVNVQIRPLVCPSSAEVRSGSRGGR